MSLPLVRLDDRLIHGQVVVGWGRALSVGLVVLVDDRVRTSDWEQDLFRMGMPPGMELEFASVSEAVSRVPAWTASRTATILVTGDVDTLVRLVEGAPGIRRVNLGGIHHRADRRQRLPYVYLSESEAGRLQGLAARGIEVTAQDVPTARAVPLGDLP